MKPNSFENKLQFFFKMPKNQLGFRVIDLLKIWIDFGSNLVHVANGVDLFCNGWPLILTAKLLHENTLSAM